MPRLRMEPAYLTPLGRAYHADALDVLRTLPDESVAMNAAPSATTFPRFVSTPLASERNVVMLSSNAAECPSTNSRFPFAARNMLSPFTECGEPAVVLTFPELSTRMPYN